MDDFVRNQGANPGRSSFRMAVEADRTIREARSVLKDFFNAPSPDHIVFTLNCTDALNIAVKGLLSSGDHVITSSLEHNSVSRPLNSLAKAGVTYSRVTHCADGLIDPDEIRKLIRKETKLIVLTHASNVLGTLEPVKDIGTIASGHNVIFLLDAAQTAGVVPIDIKEMQVDILACPGHKALLGPPGTGLLVINDRVEINPFREGGTGSLSQEPFQPLHYPDRLEAGTPNTLGIAGLKAGVEYILKEGLEKIRNHELMLMDFLLKGLSPIPGVTVYGTPDSHKRIGLVSFNIDGWEPQDVAAAMESKFDIACRAGLHCSPWAHQALGTYPLGAVRFGISCFNKKSEMAAAIEAVAELAK